MTVCKIEERAKKMAKMTVIQKIVFSTPLLVENEDGPKLEPKPVPLA